MILLNIDYIPGKEFDALGIVKGSTIQALRIGKDLVGSFKHLVGGELSAYNDMMCNARALATKRMSDEAVNLSADAVINVRYATSTVAAGAAEVIAYGTAIRFRN